jgi:hypothetical protein
MVNNEQELKKAKILIDKTRETMKKFPALFFRERKLKLLEEFEKNVINKHVDLKLDEEESIKMRAYIYLTIFQGDCILKQMYEHFPNDPQEKVLKYRREYLKELVDHLVDNNE